jgi:hypothetical protein
MIATLMRELKARRRLKQIAAATRRAEGLSRRMVIASLFGLCATLAPYEREAHATALFLRGGKASSGSLIITGNGFGDSTFASTLPQGMNTLLYRSFQTTRDEADIGLAEECMPYRTVPPSSFVIGGPDAGDFEAGAANGYIRPTAACWASGDRRTRTIYVTPRRSGVGDGPQFTVQMKFAVSAAEEYFISYQTATGAQTSQTGSYSNPYKFLPGSADFAGTAKTFNAGTGQVVFWKGERHYTTAWSNKTSPTSAGLPHGGASGGKELGFELCGWGSGAAGNGRATFDGSDAASGSPATVIQSDVMGNANYASIRRLTGQTYIERFQRLNQITAQLYEATWPTPSDIRNGCGVDYVNSVGNELYGTRNYPVQTTGGTRRMYTDGPSADGFGGSVTTLTVVDPDFNALLSGQTQANLLATGMYGVLRNGSSFWQNATLATWTPGTSTLTFTYSGTISTGDGFGSFSLRNHPLFIAKAGQAAIDSTRTQVDYWPINGNGVYISRRLGAIPLRSGDYITWRGGAFEHFCNGTDHLSTNLSAGIAYWYQSSGTNTEVHLINGWYRRVNVDDTTGAGVITIQGGAAAGMIASRIEGNYFEECNNSAGLRFAAMFTGAAGTGGSVANIRALTGGKIAHNSWADHACIGTIGYFAESDGVHIHHNHIYHHTTPHGNVWSPYDYSSTQYNQNMVIELNTIWNGSRFFTKTTAKSGDNHITIQFNAVANPAHQGAAIQANGSMDGVRIQNNLILGYGSTYAELYAIQFGPGGANMDISSNVSAGICTSLTTAVGGTGLWTGAIHDNDNTVNGSLHDPGTSTSTGTYTSNLQYTGTPNALRPYWDGETFTANDKTRIGLGPIGASHLIAA